MQKRKTEKMRQEERDKVWKKRADRFWGAFLFTKNGKVKSALLLYSFFLSVGYVAVYVIAYAFLVTLIHPILDGAPVVVVNFVEAAVPTVVGTAVCALAWLMPEKRMMLSAYLWMAAMAIACLVAMLIILGGDAQAQILFLKVFALFVPAPILLGIGLSLWLYLRHMRLRPPMTDGKIEKPFRQ